MIFASTGAENAAYWFLLRSSLIINVGKIIGRTASVLALIDWPVELNHCYVRLMQWTCSNIEGKGL